MITTCYVVLTFHKSSIEVEGISSQWIIAELKECIRSGDLQRGETIHNVAIHGGYDSSNLFVAGTLIDMYSKCGSIECARRVFDGIKHPDIVCWNALILGYAACGKSETALELFSLVERQGCAPDARSFMAALKACTVLAASEDGTLKVASGEIGKRLHLLALGCLDLHLQGALVDMYSKCGSIDEARKVFDIIKHRDAVCWNALILGYADNGQEEVALDLLLQMRYEGCAPVSRTFVAALKACTGLVVKGMGNLRVIEQGKLVHLLALSFGCSLDDYVQVTLVNMYAKCGSMEDSHQVFETMQHPNVASWNALILGYADNGQAEIALDMFSKMQRENYKPDAITFAAAMKACTVLESRDKGRALHLIAATGGYVSDMKVLRSLIDMYASLGSMKDACCIFDRMEEPDVMCWNALISGYMENGEGVKALDCFALMRPQGFIPNHATYISALKACGKVGALEVGKAIHAEVCSRGLERDHVVLTNCLVDFYAKCGSLGEARNVFESQSIKLNLITWTSLISGYSFHGDTESVFNLFNRMLDSGLQPNSITFLCVLTSCSHTGSIDKGKEYFDAVSTKYGIIPGIEHYTCMIDMLGRANKLDEAMVFSRRMHLSPSDVTWKSILGACQKWKNVQLANLAFESLSE